LIKTIVNADTGYGGGYPGGNYGGYPGGNYGGNYGGIYLKPSLLNKYK
jgi:hypothetical protein